MEDFDNSTTSTEQGLLQIKPETSRDEQLAFIDTLRDIQGTQNQEIQDTTHALGSDLPPQLGGINGTNSYWLSRYQTPQTESRIATLRTAAQSSALNTALNNYLNKLQEDYNKAARKASKRERNRALRAMYGGGGNNPTTGPGNDYVEPQISTEELKEYDVVEDAFSKRASMDLFGQKMMEEAAKRHNMSVEEYQKLLEKQRLGNSGSAGDAFNVTNGVGSYNKTTGTFDNGLNLRK